MEFFWKQGEKLSSPGKQGTPQQKIVTLGTVYEQQAEDSKQSH